MNSKYCELETDVDEVVFALFGDEVPLDRLHVAQVGILLDQDRSSLDIRQRSTFSSTKSTQNFIFIAFFFFHFYSIFFNNLID